MIQTTHLKPNRKKDNYVETFITNYTQEKKMDLKWPMHCSLLPNVIDDQDNEVLMKNPLEEEERV